MPIAEGVTMGAATVGLSSAERYARDYRQHATSELDRLREENQRLRLQNADCAVLRRAFNDAAARIEEWLKAPMAKGDQRAAVWLSLYEAVIGTQGGLLVLQEIQDLKDELSKNRDPSNPVGEKHG
jgi:hypothetical protein